MVRFLGTRPPWYSRRLNLLKDLRDPSIDLSAKPVCSLLQGLFPGTKSVEEVRCRSQLVFSVDQMPRPPWPAIIGGLPFTINDDNGSGRTMIFPILSSLPGTGASICNDKSYREAVPMSSDDLRQLCTAVLAHFRANLPEIQIVEIMFTTYRFFHVFLSDSVDIHQSMSKLPCFIAKCFAKYHNERELCRPVLSQQQAKREITPQPFRNIMDRTPYSVIRPGVMISSHTESSVIAESTSGVLVINKNGNKYMTAATHRIGASGIVNVSNSDKRIGTASADIPCTDICLVELEDDVKFENQPFDASGDDAWEITRLARSNDDFAGNVCFLDSPFTGYMTGCIVAKSFKVEELGPVKHVVYEWIYMGQEEGNYGKVRPPNGTCGSAIWNEDGVVLGFYLFYISEGNWAGFSASVSASELSREGFELST